MSDTSCPLTFQRVSTIFGSILASRFIVDRLVTSRVRTQNFYFVRKATMCWFIYKYCKETCSMQQILIARVCSENKTSSTMTMAWTRPFSRRAKFIQHKSGLIVRPKRNEVMWTISVPVMSVRETKQHSASFGFTADFYSIWQSTRGLRIMSSYAWFPHTIK